MTSKTTDQSVKPSIRSGLLVSFVTILVGLLIIEGVARWAFKTSYQWDRRLMFFSEGHNFRNTEWGGVLYQPHDSVHAQTYYITNLDPPEVRLEYSYDFTTNAIGLVQLNDLTDSKPAILLLGDSFTEGQGARPWFYQLERDWPDRATYQLVNGGMIGTGVEAWGRLYRELSTEVKVAKIVIIFISDDWTRPVWQFPQQTLDCLKVAAQCEGDENFYGLPAEPDEARSELNRIAKYRVDSLAKRLSGTNILWRSALYRHLIAPAFRRLVGFPQTGTFRGAAARQFDVSKTVVTDIINRLGRDNVLFIYLPQKTELTGGPHSFGRKAKDFILQNGFAFVDGRATCGLTTLDYYEHDGHPNARGYAKIARCVQRAIEGAFHPL